MTERAHEQEDPDRTTAISSLQIVAAKNFTAAADAYAVDTDPNPHSISGLWFISLLGAQSAVKAISAAILKGPGDTIHVTPIGEDGEPEYAKSLFTTRKQNSGPWTRRILQLPGTRAWHCLAYPTMAEQPSDDGRMLIIGRKDGKEHADEAEIHLRKLNQAVNIPIHSSWARWIWQRGEELDEIKRLEGAGINAWLSQPQEELLKEEISQAVAAGELTADTE